MSSRLPPDQSLTRYEPHRLEIAQRRTSTSGRWALWFGTFISCVWFGLLGMIAFATPILDAFKADIYIFSALLLALATPGILLFFSGLFARAQSQTAAANALVLEAANHLLLPSATASESAQTHAQNLKSEAESVERAMTQAVAVLRSFSGELETRKNTLFETTGNTVERTEELIRKLSEERHALSELAETINSQLSHIGHSVPKHASILAEALKGAGGEVHNAEETLERRLSDFDSTEARLVKRMKELDALAQSTASYSSKLDALVSQIDARLHETTKLIDASVKAGELASAAAKSTGDALQQAVSNALDGARLANDEIAVRTIETAEKAGDAIAKLKGLGAETHTLYQAIIDDARIESAKIADKSQEEMTRLRHEGTIPEWVADKKNSPEKAEHSATVSRPPLLGSSASQNQDSENVPIFDLEREFLEDTSVSEDPTEKEQGDAVFGESGFIITDLDTPPDAPIRLSRLSEDIPDETTMAENAKPDSKIGRESVAPKNFIAPAKQTPSNSWSDILADVDRARTTNLPPREETAELLVLALERNGIDLNKIFKPKDKKRIAVAARRGDYARRSAIKESARNYVGATESLLISKPELREAAQVFLEYENTEALQALEKTHKSNKNAGIRLALYLLLDAAMGKVRAA